MYRLFLIDTYTDAIKQSLLNYTVQVRICRIVKLFKKFHFFFILQIIPFKFSL